MGRAPCSGRRCRGGESRRWPCSAPFGNGNCRYRRAKALGRSQGIVEKKSTMPILSHVLLEARKSGHLVVSATDLDLAVSSEHE